MSKRYLVFVLALFILIFGNIQNTVLGQSNNNNTPTALPLNSNALIAAKAVGKGEELSLALKQQGDQTAQAACQALEAKYNQQQGNIAKACGQIRQTYGESSAPTDLKCVEDATNCEQNPATAKFLDDNRNQIIKDIDPRVTDDQQAIIDAGLDPSTFDNAGKKQAKPVPPMSSSEYCHPSDSTSTVSASPSATPDPDCNQADIKDTGKPACLKIGVQDRINALADSTNSDDSKVGKDQKSFDSAESKLEEKTASCQGDIIGLNAQITKAQADMKKASTDEMTQVGGANTELTAALATLQTKIDAATLEEQNIMGPKATTIMNNYNAAILAATSACHKKLVVQGQNNQLTYGNISQALGASRTGITSSKCSTDFDTQVATALAWQTYQQSLQANQVLYMQQQVEIANLNQQILTTKMGDAVKRNAIASQDAYNITALQSSISSLTQQVMAKQNECTQAENRMQQQTQNYQGTADASTKDFRINYCQLQDLQDRCGMHVTSKRDPDTKALDKLNDLITSPDMVQDQCAVETVNGSAQYTDPAQTIPSYTGGPGCVALCNKYSGGKLILHDSKGNIISK